MKFIRDTSLLILGACALIKAISPDGGFNARSASDLLPLPIASNAKHQLSISPVLAGPLGDCCVRGGKYARRGVSVGRVETIAGVETYISYPPANTTGPTKVILFFADIYGPFDENAKQLQNYFASRGFYVLGIDYFFGDSVSLHTDDPSFDMLTWAAEARKRAADATPGWIDAVREKYGADAKYNAVGYCFGAPFALEIASTDKVVASAFAHPVSLNDEHFKKLAKPLLLSCAETDPTFPTASRRRAEDILVEIKATYYIEVFSGVEHGFAVRGDAAIENIRWAKEQSARSIVSWFLRFSS